MESRLDGLFRTGFRQTESADTRLGIRRDESEDGRKNKSSNKDDEEADSAWEDVMTLSVPTLQQFLLGLINPDSPYQAPPATPETETTGLSPQQKTAHNAAQAYQATARHQNITPPAPPAPAVQDNPRLSAGENRIIHQLLNDLETLMNKNIATLSLRKDGTFLESLQKAVTAALA